MRLRIRGYAEIHRFDDALPFRIGGVYCKLIPLTKGQYVIVCESDYNWLMQWTWYARWNTPAKRFYAARGERLANGRRCIVYLHRFILGLPFGDLREGDHINPADTLDCRRSNLRIVSAAQNMWNRRKNKNNKSGFKGVFFREDTGKWSAQIMVNGKRITLGSFKTKSEARAAYAKAAALYHGEYARTE